MPAVQNKLAFEALASVAIAAGYSNLGSAFTNQIRILKIANETTGAITVSFDGGTTDHEHMAANSFLLLDASSNRVWDCELAFPNGTQVAVKGAGAGSVYLSRYYAT
jgi:hypothetical protein